MKNKRSLIILIITFYAASAIFSNGDDFKAGLMGKPPVAEVQK